MQVTDKELQEDLKRFKNCNAACNRVVNESKDCNKFIKISHLYEDCSSHKNKLYDDCFKICVTDLEIVRRLKELWEQK